MATFKYTSYADFVKSVLKAVPLDISHTELGLTTVLRKNWKGRFGSIGDLVSLCGKTDFKECPYLVEIIEDKKWIPRNSRLTDFYIINELVLATMIVIKPRNSSRGGGVGFKLDSESLPATAGFEYSESSGGGLEIKGKQVNGEIQPFPIGYRTAHVIYKADGSFDLKRPIKFGVRRGEDDGIHISELVLQDEEYHIGEFFVEDEPGEDDDQDEEDDPSLKVVPVIFDAAEEDEDQRER
ncbi:hypothetical protein R1sor_000676 [Riccia sorocarpa]|uniref:Uncharacterized protein n=1 Tax=Riccia sorocarpa TaxID=122646 RepID=A0ABD3GZT0_9MARC